MATVVNSTPLCPSVSLKPIIGNSVGGKFLRAKPVFHTGRFPSLEVKATDGSNKSTKTNSIVCADCDGNVACLLVSLTAQQQVSCNCTCCMWPCRSRASIYACFSYDWLFLEFHSVLASLSFPFLVQYRVLNAKVRELILWTTSMDSLKLVDYVGSAEVKGRFCVEVVTELALSVDS
ncbi:hypothetical protein NC653_039599 [Populus alba x Populus x berolinensis]|uniref:Uncharacterized protein n=1 Tax=Populus alba x Populus x berolinensis TaxID=444605 RepID=A0AAD6LE70_9ROSI|nr:hypothetical protein NC653_039599 [Populus alba x Populus x berolinensis]